MNLNHGDWKRKALTFLLGGVILSSTVTVGFNTIMSKEVSLIIDGKEREVITYTSTVEELLKSEGIELSADQEIEPAKDTKISKNMDIVIKSPQEYKIKEGDKIEVKKAIGDNVAEVLEDLNIVIDGDDVVTPKLNSPISAGKTISIERVYRETYQSATEIPFETTKVANDNMYKGDEKVVQKGVAGRRIDTIQNTFVNGALVSIDTLSSAVESEPVNAIVEYGTKEVPSSVQGMNVKKVIVMQATAYDPSAGTKTAMGTRARVGAVAVDPRVIPLGTKLYIESMDGFPTYGYAVAEDTGGAIKGNRIDLFYNSNAEANRFGRRNVKVYVLE